MTPYQRAVRGYDEEHERALVDAITKAIVEASMISDANVIALRTGECSSALVTVLAGTLALSPSVMRSPAALRKTIDALGKRLRRRVAIAESDSELQDFVARCFNGLDVEGNA